MFTADIYNLPEPRTVNRHQPFEQMNWSMPKGFYYFIKKVDRSPLDRHECPVGPFDSYQDAYRDAHSLIIDLTRDHWFSKKKPSNDNQISHN